MPKKYKIVCYYITGDSFHTEETSTTLELTYNSYNRALKTVERIKEHYKWYRNEERYYGRRVKIPKPKWLDVKDPFYSINLETDGGLECKLDSHGVATLNAWNM